MSSLWPIVIGALAGLAVAGTLPLRRRSAGVAAGVGGPDAPRTDAAGRCGIAIVRRRSRPGRDLEGRGAAGRQARAPATTPPDRPAAGPGTARVARRRARAPGVPSRGPGGSVTAATAGAAPACPRPRLREVTRQEAPASPRAGVGSGPPGPARRTGRSSGERWGRDVGAQTIQVLVGLLVGLLIGLGGVSLALQVFARRGVRAARTKAQEILAAARFQAETIRKEADLQAKEEALRRREADRRARSRRPAATSASRNAAWRSAPTCSTRSSS